MSHTECSKKELLQEAAWFRGKKAGKLNCDTLHCVAGSITDSPSPQPRCHLLPVVPGTPARVTLTQQVQATARQTALKGDGPGHC
jgi:hypothetical protein